MGYMRDLTGRRLDSFKVASQQPTALGDPSTMPNGTPTALTTGQTVRTFGNAPMTVSSGKYVHTPFAGANSAAYMQANLGARVTRIGADFTFPDSTSSAVALVIPLAEWNAGGSGPLGPAGIHFRINSSGTYVLSYWNGGVEEPYFGGSGLLPAYLYDGATHRVEIALDGDTAWLFLPDGSVKNIVDPRIKDNVSTWAIWELFESNGATTTPGTLTRVWADTVDQAAGGTRYPTLADIGRAAAPTRMLAPNLKQNNYYYTSSPHASSAVQFSNGNFRCVPWIVPNECTLRRLAADISVAGEAGAKFRLGVYADDGTGFPGALVVDAGQIAADAVGVFELTVSPVLEPGVYWIGGVTQNVVTTAPSVRTGNNWPPPIPIATGTALPAANGTVAGYAMAGITGALPTTWTSGTSPVGTYPRIIVKTSGPS